MNDMKKLNFPGCTMKFQLNLPQLIKRGIRRRYHERHEKTKLSWLHYEISA